MLNIELDEVSSKDLYKNKRGSVLLGIAWKSCMTVGFLFTVGAFTHAY